MTSTGANTAPHVPVLVSEVIAALALQHGETAVDAFFGHEALRERTWDFMSAPIRSL